MGTMVFQYGLLKPTMNEQLVREQLRLAHRYRNDRTQWRRGQRSALREIEEQAGLEEPLRELVRAKAVLATSIAVLKAERAKKCTKEGMAELRNAVATARGNRREAFVALREKRAAIREDVQAARDSISERWLELERSLRGAYSQAGAGLRHGTYTLVEDAEQRANADIPLWDGDRPQDPRFLRWTGDGSVGVQVQYGIAVEELLSCEDTRVQLDVPSGRYGTLRLRVGTGEQRSAIWAEFPIKLHRPLPKGARVKRINVSVRRVGPRERWTAEVVLDMPDGWRREPCGQGAVGVDLGWRVVDHDIHLGAWADEQGKTGVTVLPSWQDRLDGMKRSMGKERGRRSAVVMDVPRTLDRFRVAEALGSVREKARERWRGALIAMRRKIGEAMPTELRSTMACAHCWRAAARFVGLARYWRREHPEFGSRFLDAMERWLEHDRHLWQWQESQRSKAIRWRNDLYRREAAALARRYSVLVLERFDVREVAARPSIEQELPAGDDRRRDDYQRHYRQCTAPATYREALMQAFAARGGQVVTVPREGTTTTHVECRGEIEWHPDVLEQECPHCGRLVHRDVNAARMLLAYYRERPGDVQTPGGARKPKNGGKSAIPGETPHQKRKRLRAEKLARMAIAREPGSTCA